MKKPSTPKALERVAAALSYIQLAQTELDNASQELSGLRFGAAESDIVFKERERVHKLWYRIAKMRDKPGMSCDSEDP